MASDQEDLAALRAQVASLTARVHKLEQQAGVDPMAATGTPQRPAPPATQAYVPGAETPSRPIVPPPPPPPPRAPVFAALNRAKDRASSGDDLEGQIGKLWLNRIGVAAILIGVA